ncbi:MAG: hypothetical protein OZ921_07260 [Sorangiineae bacterium]|nr:hypothetical protein [Polyangiaceae bacterium]MEB2322294.1 hypothetical protein [Sorangiineae bacterium]
MGFRTQWRGQRDTAAWRRLGKLLGLSLVLHLPLTPLGALAGLLGLITRGPAEALPVEPVDSIPIDLIEESGESPAGKPPSEPERGPAPAPSEPEPDPFAGLDDEPDEDALALVDSPKPEEPRAPARAADAGAPDASDAAAPDAAPPDASDAAASVAAASDGGHAEAGAGRGIGDPVALSGAAGRVVDGNANVRLIVFTDRIRDTELGDKVGALLASANQWYDFFGPSGLDPVKDFDRILIAGPQLRDSSAVVAVLRYNTSEAKIRAALAALVARDEGGRWLDAGVPAAQAKADRAERVFALPAPHLVVVAPPSAAAAALALPRSTRFPAAKGGEVLTAFVRTPWRAFLGIPFDIPKTIAWVRLSIAPSPGGGAVATLDAEDATPEDARRNAAALSRAINAVTQVNVLFIRQRFIEPVSLEADGRHIRGVITATPSQLRDLVGMVAGLARELGTARGIRDAGSPSVAPPPADAEPPRDAGATRADAGPRRDASDASEGSAPMRSAADAAPATD